MTSTHTSRPPAIGLARIAALVEAFNRHDARACAECFAEDGAREHRFLSRVLAPGQRFPRAEGREGIAGGYERFFTTVSEVVVRTERLDEAADGTVWMEWTISGTSSGEAAPAQPVSFPGVSIFKMAGALIEEERIYLDPALASPPPAGDARAARTS